ncbi:MAG: Gfo/Idh/MocA family oxidoreductase [Chthoniobacterales bacterium]
MKKNLRLAMLGMIPGNGHPYSWSAIINGFDPAALADCPYPAIQDYMGKRNPEEVGIDGAEVTHLWTDNAEEASSVVAFAKIPNIVSRPEDVIGEVDAVIISTDDGSDHVRRARAFVEAGLPVFVDKPLATNREELTQFVKWQKGGARILSSSGMRYAPKLEELEGEKWDWMTNFTCKTWERYGIHALEPIFRLVGPGFTQIRCEAQAGSDIVYCRHESGFQATVAAIHEAYGSFGAIHAYGAKEQKAILLRDTYASFRGQLVAVVEWLQTGVAPFPFEHTMEMMAILIAAQDSRERGGELIAVQDILNPILEKL